MFYSWTKSEEPINVSLNYGYSVVRAMLARSVVAKGLIPTLGVFHRNPYNHFNFVDDLMEVYRPFNWWMGIFKYEGIVFHKRKKVGISEVHE